MKVFQKKRKIIKIQLCSQLWNDVQNIHQKLTNTEEIKSKKDDGRKTIPKTKTEDNLLQYYNKDIHTERITSSKNITSVLSFKNNSNNDTNKKIDKIYFKGKVSQQKYQPIKIHIENFKKKVKGQNDNSVYQNSKNIQLKDIQVKDIQLKDSELKDIHLKAMNKQNIYQFKHINPKINQSLQLTNSIHSLFIETYKEDKDKITAIDNLFSQLKNIII